jgi:LmbE family N-acetylglucosaminyl deacetylase
MSLQLSRLNHLVLLAAHCDDIAIGAGATVLQLCRRFPGLRVSALVLTGAGTVREDEERAALAAFCPGAELSVEVHGFLDGRVPAQWREAKAAVSGLAKAGPADLVLAPQPGDAHQDHRALAEFATQEFRDHLIAGYEILKLESDLPQVTSYVPADAETVATKVALLHEHYPSQVDHDWFDPEAFTGLMRVRGAQCHAHYAEGFVVPKAVWNV